MNKLAQNLKLQKKFFYATSYRIYRLTFLPFLTVYSTCFKAILPFPSNFKGFLLNLLIFPRFSMFKPQKIENWCSVLKPIKEQFVTGQEGINDA